MKDLFDLFKSQPMKTLCTLLTGAITVILLSIMGWLFLTFPEPTQPPRLEADKGEIIRLTPAAMKAATYEYNKRKEAQARGEK